MKRCLDILTLAVILAGVLTAATVILAAVLFGRACAPLVRLYHRLWTA